MAQETEHKESATLLWFDPNIGSQMDAELTKQELRSISDYVTFQTELDEYVQFIRGIKKGKDFLITSGSIVSQLLPHIIDLPQVDCVFIFSIDKVRYQHLVHEYAKFIDCYIDLSELCSSIRQQIDLCDKQLQTFSAFDHCQKSRKDLLKQSSEFLWFQLFHHLIIRLLSNDEAKQQMTEICRRYYRGKTQESALIDQSEQEYRAEDAIRWQSKQSFVYKLVNKALRTEDLDQLQTFRFFVSDLSKRLSEEHQKMLASDETILVVYRGTKLDIEDFRETS